MAQPGAIELAKSRRYRPIRRRRAKAKPAPIGASRTITLAVGEHALRRLHA